MTDRSLSASQGTEPRRRSRIFSKEKNSCVSVDPCSVVRQRYHLRGDKSPRPLPRVSEQVLDRRRRALHRQDRRHARLSVFCALHYGQVQCRDDRSRHPSRIAVACGHPGFGCRRRADRPAWPSKADPVRPGGERSQRVDVRRGERVRVAVPRCGLRRVIFGGRRPRACGDDCRHSSEGAATGRVRHSAGRRQHGLARRADHWRFRRPVVVFRALRHRRGHQLRRRVAVLPVHGGDKARAATNGTSRKGSSRRFATIASCSPTRPLSRFSSPPC